MSWRQKLPEFKLFLRCKGTFSIQKVKWNIKEERCLRVKLECDPYLVFRSVSDDVVNDDSVPCQESQFSPRNLDGILAGTARKEIWSCPRNCLWPKEKRHILSSFVGRYVLMKQLIMARTTGIVTRTNTRYKKTHVCADAWNHITCEQNCLHAWQKEDAMRLK